MRAKEEILCEHAGLRVPRFIRGADLEMSQARTQAWQPSGREETRGGEERERKDRWRERGNDMI
jgi:hypothetical protein